MKGDFNRGTGLLVVEAIASNPNGDPDLEGAPRTVGPEQRGLISPVSVKRKLRDLVSAKLDGDGKPVHGPAFDAAREALGLEGDRYGILESRDRRRGEIGKMDRDAFVNAYWDARVFGNTFLESMKEEKESKGKKGEEKRDVSHFISTGVVQIGPGLSIAPVVIERGTLTNKPGVQEGKDRGMAPFAWKFVPHALYAIPFFVNPMAAGKSGCTARDIDLMLFLMPHIYRATASTARPDVDVLHAWYATHKSPLGSCPDWKILDALKPKKKDGPDRASTSRAEYDIPDGLPDDIRERLSDFDDLAMRDWG